MISPSSRIFPSGTDSMLSNQHLCSWLALTLNFPLLVGDAGASDMEPDLATELPKIFRVPAVQGPAIKQLNNSVHEKAGLETMKVLLGKNFSFFSISELISCSVQLLLWFIWKSRFYCLLCLLFFWNVLCGRKFNKTLYSQLSFELSDFRPCSF